MLHFRQLGAYRENKVNACTETAIKSVSVTVPVLDWRTVRRHPSRHTISPLAPRDDDDIVVALE